MKTLWRWVRCWYWRRHLRKRLAQGEITANDARRILIKKGLLE
jgi:hypothetical protein